MTSIRNSDAIKKEMKIIFCDHVKLTEEIGSPDLFSSEMYFKITFIKMLKYFHIYIVCIAALCWIVVLWYFFFLNLNIFFIVCPKST